VGRGAKKIIGGTGRERGEGWRRCEGREGDEGKKGGRVKRAMGKTGWKKKGFVKWCNGGMASGMIRERVRGEKAE